MNNYTDIIPTIDPITEFQLISIQVFFYLFLFLDIPGMILGIFLFYCFIHLPELRRDHHSYQMTIYLTTCAFFLNVIDIPLMLPYLQNHYYIVRMNYSNAFCVFWIIYDYGMCSLNVWMMALFSFERYLVIFFKPIVMKTKSRRFFLYYILVTTMVLFFFCWYISLITSYPCTQYQFDYTQILCGLPCYMHEGSKILRNLDWILAGLMPAFLTIFFTLILILQVLYQRQKTKRHLMYRDTWKRTRKMFLQLLPITVTFIVFALPVIMVGLMSISDPWYGTMPYSFASTWFYCLPLSMPFVVLIKEKVIRKRLFRCLRQKPRNQTVPIVNDVRPLQSMHIQVAQNVHAQI